MATITNRANIEPPNAATNPFRKVDVLIHIAPFNLIISLSEITGDQRQNCNRKLAARCLIWQCEAIL